MGKTKYLFRDRKTGEPHEVELTWNQITKNPTYIKRKGRELERDVQAELYRDSKNKKSGKIKLIPRWPIESEAAAVNPEDVKEAQSQLYKHGVQTDFTKSGEPIFRTPKHRKRHCEALGFIDRNGGYSDPMRN